MSDNNITYRLIDNVKNHPDKIALIDNTQTFSGKVKYKHYTYKNILDDIIETSYKLKQKGFKKGDRILIFIPMCYELYITVIAIFSIGAVVVFMDAWANKQRLSDSCKVVKPRGFIGSIGAQVLKLVPEIRKIPIKLKISQVFSKGTGKRNLEIVETQAEDEALITLTTGTTGLPKGANRTHGLLWNQFKIIGEHLNLKHDDIDLTALPIFIFNNLGVGITSVLPIFNPAKPTAFNVKKIIQQIIDCNITTSIGSPAFFEKIADHIISKKSKYKKVSIRKIFTGGAPVFKPLAKKLRNAFSNTEIEVVYGCTEVEPISGIDLKSVLDNIPGSGLPVGPWVPDLEVKIIKPITGELKVNAGENIAKYTVPHGEVGEIIVHGPHVLKDYIGNPKNYIDTKIYTKDKVWHRTGDAGCIDKKGNILLHGRIKNRFVVKNQTFYPIPFEQRLIDIEEVVFSSVIELEGKIFAVIELDNQISSRNTDQIIEKAKIALKDIHPVEIRIVERIPRDPRHNSKVDFEGLKKLIKN